MPLRLLGRKSSAILENRDVELQDTVRPDPEGRVGILIGDLEMVSQVSIGVS